MQRVEVVSAEVERDVFRFVRTASAEDPRLLDDFRSDAERGKTPRGRSATVPGLMDGMSAFRSLELARDRWQDLAQLAARRGQPVAVGDSIASVTLRSGRGFAYEDLGDPGGHMTIWGSPERLVAAVAEVVPAAV